MSISTVTKSAPPIVVADVGSASQPWAGSRATLTSHRLNGAVAVISARGDIDASSGGALVEYTLGCAAACHALVLDLGGLSFFGTEGLQALQRVAAYCVLSGTEWATVPGTAVSRMLQIGDPLSLLPVAKTVDAALKYLARQSL
jgi:anti-anti-sigma factor